MTNTSSATAAPLPSNAQSPPTQQTMSSTPTSTGQLQGSGLSNTGSTALTFDQVENYWIQAGGNPQSAAMAAAVADAESGLNPGASRVNPDGTVGVGLWLTPQNGTPPGSNDPLAAARAALHLSQNGTDWTQWCSTWSDNNCGQNGGTYLGSGANALMSLGTQSEPQSYNQFGATPSGSGVGASTATQSGILGSLTGGGLSSSKSSTGIVILIVVVVVIGAIYISRRQGGGDSQAGGDVESEGYTRTSPTGKTVRIRPHTRGRPTHFQQ